MYASDLDAGLLAELLDHLGEHRALRVGDQVVGVAEDERVVGDAEARIAARRERRPADDHVDGAERHALVDVGFLAERADAGNTSMSNLPLVRFLISAAAHTDSVWYGSLVS